MATSITDTPFPSANNYSLIVTGDANLGSGPHVHGAAYVGGNLSLSGSNMEVTMDSNPPPVGLVVAGNVQDSQSGSRIAMHGSEYYVGGTTAGVTYSTGTALSSDPLWSPANIAQALSDKSAQLASLSSSGASIDTSDPNNVKINLTAGVLNVLNLNASNAGFLTNLNTVSFNNMTAGTEVVINYDLGSSGLDFESQILNNNLSNYDNIIWNFIGNATLALANHVSSFYGSIVAPQAVVNWNANDLYGQLVAQSVNWPNTSEIHFYQPWTTTQVAVGSSQLATVPISGVLYLLVPGLLMLFPRTRRRVSLQRS